MSAPRPVTHVIFDMDGLILDTERLYTIASQTVCSQYGKDFTWDIKVKQMGKKEIESVMIIIDELQLPLTPEEYIEKWRAEQINLFPTAPFLPGAEKLIKHLHGHNIPIAIATGSNSWSYNLKTSNHKEVFDLFHHVVKSSDDPDVKNGKPAPDCFHVCRNRFDSIPSPEKVLVFEDASNGVLAAHSAGMQVVWVPDPRADRTETSKLATLTINSLEEFNPQDFGLPTYCS
ncbi:pseudouridine-5'-phosphatase [Patella vulgata]|uniref:pseudouridine-5'-phosphatase n=1 Tax=Patella vulgata TaxID=6465 RepID=UPI00217F6317|nr:pseudouridine-5'-phosphatase [Patella vulgata]